MNIKRILIIGGDSRIDYLCQFLSSDGYEVRKFSESDTLKGALDFCDAVILGLPSSIDDETVNAPGLEKPVLLKDLFRMMGKDKLLLGGRMSDGMKAIANVFSVKWADYFLRPEAEIKNAIPTCEGALQIAMEELPITIHGANAIVTGYGKIGKLLARDLQMLGANVTVCARRAEVRAQAFADGIKSVDFSLLPQIMENADVVFNTVPQIIFDRNVLSHGKNSLIIDLASKPGGVNLEAAQNIGVKVIWALGLPGKVAPISAGNIIKETIYNIFSELGE